MAKSKSKQKVAAAAAPKHHEMQAIKNVTYIRNAAKFLMAASLKNIRAKLSMTPGNEEFVERLRGKSGDEILARCTHFFMLEIGDSSTSLDSTHGVIRSIGRSVSGEMGLASSDLAGEEGSGEAQTA